MTNHFLKGNQLSLPKAVRVGLPSTVHVAQKMQVSLCSSDFNSVKVSQEIHAYIIRYFSYSLGGNVANSRNIQIERNGNHLGYCLIPQSFSQNDKDHFKDSSCLMGRKQLTHRGLKETPQVVKKQSQGQAAPMSTSFVVETFTVKKALRMGCLGQREKVFHYKTCGSNIMHTRYSEKIPSTNVYKCQIK